MRARPLACVRPHLARSLCLGAFDVAAPTAAAHIRADVYTKMAPFPACAWLQLGLPSTAAAPRTRCEFAEFPLLTFDWAFGLRPGERVSRLFFAFFICRS